MTSQIKPHKIIAVTETTRVRHFTFGGVRLRRSAKPWERVAVWRGFRLVASFGAVLLALMLGACSACPPRGPRAVRIDPTFSAEQTQAISDAVDAWDTAAGLTVAISSWDDPDAVPIFRDDSIVESMGDLGYTNVNSKDHSGDYIQLATAGTFKSGRTVGEYDMKRTAAHELGHLFGCSKFGDPGVDGHGHSSDSADLMYGHGQAGVVPFVITPNDVARVEAVIEKIW